MLRILAPISIVAFLSSATANSGQFEPLIFPELPVAVLDSGNDLCKKESDVYVRNLKNFTLWAYEMWDSTAKAPTGILRGSVFQMGHYEQCVTAEAPFLTQYCLTTLTINVPRPNTSRNMISLYHPPDEFVLDRLYPTGDPSQQNRNIVKLGWCLPASCTPSDAETFLNSYVNELDMPLNEFNTSYKAQIADLGCHTKDENVLTGADITFCLLTLILALMVIFVTIVDFNTEKEEKPVKKSLLCRLLVSFSARKNFNDLTRMDDSNSALTILYGVRTICILCIIMDHRFGTFTSSALLNFDWVERQYRAPLAPFLFHGDLFVDNFFLLSGLLVTYGLLNQFDKKRMNPGFIILMRYIRLTPVYAFVIFYYATVFNYTGSGPLWKMIAGQDSQDCKDNWWTNILYISNYVNADHMCMTHSWYLPCDFHYFIIGILVCLMIKKDKKLGLFTLLLLTVISIIIPFVLTIVYLRPALLHFYPEFLTGPKIHPDFLLTYCKSHTRATPYFLGMFAGYIYYKLQNTNKHICRIKSYLILLVSVFMIIVAILGGAVFYDPFHKYNALESATYAGLHRPAFTIGSFGILYVASFGHAGFIYAILSWKPWIPLSKLVYGAYLIHMQFQLRAAAKFMNPRHMTYFDVISLSLSDMVLAFLTALCLYLMIEAPFRRIFRELLAPSKVSPPRQNNAESNNTELMSARENGNCDSSRL